MTTTIVPGIRICGCSEYASVPHFCEYRPATPRVRLCECGEFTTSPECGPCRLPEDEIPPMPANAPRWRVKDCGHLPGDECGCVTAAAEPMAAPAIGMGAAFYGWRSR